VEVREPRRMARLAGMLCAITVGVLVPASPAFAVAQSFTATLVGTQEFPTNASTATGAATVDLNAAETSITVNVNFSGLTSNAIAGHIHAHNPVAPAPPGTNANVRFGFTGVPAATSGTVPTQTFTVTAPEVLKLRTGQWYVNIHSSSLPGGEIRGQVVTSVSYPALVTGSITWNLRNALTTGPATTAPFDFGAKPNVPFVCDLDGNGSETPVSYESGTFKVRNSNSAGAPDSTIAFGDARGFPLGGDFDGDAKDDVAVYRNGTWQVRYTVDGSSSTFSFGPGGNWPNTIPVTGDWDGNGIDGIGTYTYSTATWNLRNTASTGTADAGTFVYGTPTSSYPVAGDWNLDNRETVGTKTGVTWALRDTNNAGAANTMFDFGAASGIPLGMRGPTPP
jgi:hypothetical protein